MEFHPNEENKVVVVTDSQVVLFDTAEINAKCIINIPLVGKNNPKFTMGKWNSHQNCTQV